MELTKETKSFFNKKTGNKKVCAAVLTPDTHKQKKKQQKSRTNTRI
jgi:hypothetical protein